MTTLNQIALTCPICSATFDTTAVVSTNLLGTRTDFHEWAEGTQPLAFLVHTCSTCGYSGCERDFADDFVPEPAVKAHVWDELAPRLASERLTGSDKFEFAAKIARWQSADSRHVANLFLRAAWCCVDEADVEAERYFRRHAAWSFEQALASNEVEPDERALLTYLVGELWRRIGDTARAREWFDRVASEVTHPKDQKWVLRAARQQRDTPREWFW